MNKPTTPAQWIAAILLSILILTTCITAGIFLSVPSKTIGDWWSPDVNASPSVPHPAGLNPR